MTLSVDMWKGLTERPSVQITSAPAPCRRGGLSAGAARGCDGLKFLAAGLPYGLTSLHLNRKDTKVSDDGLKSLTAGLPHGLTSLDLNIQNTNVRAAREPSLGHEGAVQGQLWQ